MKILKSRQDSSFMSNLINSIGHQKKKNVYNYPYVDKDAYKTAITNYKRFVSQKNTEIELYNRMVIDVHNSMVDKVIKTINLTPEQEKSIKESKAKKVLKWNKFNELADEMNKPIPIIKKKYKAQIPYSCELVFSVILNFTASQLKKRNEIRMNSGITTVGTLPKTNLNSWQMINHNLVGCPNLFCHQETVKRHLKIFKEEGILIGYEGSDKRGTKVPARAWINPKILEIKDTESPIYLKTENQLFKSFATTKCGYIDLTTRTQLKKVNKKEHFSTSSKNEKGKLSDENITGTPKVGVPKIVPEKEQFAGAAAVDVTEILREKIDDMPELSRRLSRKEKFSTIDIQILDYEARFGYMSKPEFSELIYQEFLKNLSVLYQKTEQSPHPGSYMNAYWTLDSYKLKTFTGQFFTKTNMVEELKIWRWMILKAKKYFDRQNFNPLYPSEYLNTERKDRRQIGFWTLRKDFDKYMSRKNFQKIKKTVQKEKSIKEIAKIKKIRQLEKRISLMIRGKITENQLIDYVMINQTPDAAKNLNQIIKKVQNDLHGQN